MDIKALIGWILLVVLILFSLYPKATFIENRASMKVCNCLGLEIGENCVGFRVECDIFEKTPIEQKEILEPKTGAEIVLLLDKSNSMKGNRLLEAKSASLDLIDNMGKFQNNYPIRL